MNNKTICAIAMVAGIASAILIIVLVMNMQNNMEHAFSQSAYEDILEHKCKDMREAIGSGAFIDCKKMAGVLAN